MKKLISLLAVLTLLVCSLAVYKTEAGEFYATDPIGLDEFGVK